MATPEGTVKQRINKALFQWENVYKYMPVPGGMGAPSLDYILCVNGYWVGIEAKAPGKKPTLRQLMTMQAMEAAGGFTCVIDGDMAPLNAILNKITRRKPEYKPTKVAAREALKNRHGINAAQYAAALAVQNGHCFFCARTPDQEPHGVLCVDHDHTTGRLRGLVCRVHNHALWHFGDTTEGFEKALAYVKGATGGFAH